MTTDYFLFIHGVNVRNRHYAEKLIAALDRTIQRSAVPTQARYVPLYWGDVVENRLKQLRPQITQTSTWQSFWFRPFRLDEILEFVGDAALYISRHVGFETVSQLARQAAAGIADAQPGDRLHLVTHSWGTAILFDILFANRWESISLSEEERQLVQQVRDRVFGMGQDPETGLLLTSISTLGSPLVLFSLINETGPDSSHNISLELVQLLEQSARLNGRIPWLNFVHPGDPIAWPLERLLPGLVGPSVKVDDILVQGRGPLEILAWLLQGSFLALINGGNAHGSYWSSDTVAKRIAGTLHREMMRGVASRQARQQG